MTFGVPDDWRDQEDMDILEDLYAQEETPEDVERRMARQKANELDVFIRKATKDSQYWYLGDGEGPDPLKVLEEAFKLALEDVRSLRTHTHQWNENDYCDVCGADGRA